MLQFKILILKFFSKNRCSSSSITRSKVTTLCHESFDDSVESGSLVVKWFAALWISALFSGTQLHEIFCCLWNDIASQLKFHASQWLAVSFNLKECILQRRAILFILSSHTIKHAREESLLFLGVRTLSECNLFLHTIERLVECIAGTLQLDGLLEVLLGILKTLYILVRLRTTLKRFHILWVLAQNGIAIMNCKVTILLQQSHHHEVRLHRLLQLLCFCLLFFGESLCVFEE
mmetsp:Transcript_5700/g.21523  ORF Transcript_5700/g.21523 Transcript_5700/m.21523 type:complete len:233 (+) Transcript_5700:344-1042(+)